MATVIIVLIVLLPVCACSTCGKGAPGWVDEAVGRYAGDRDFVIIDAWTRGQAWEIVVDWQDDGSPRTCTLVVRNVDGEWVVTDEECQGW